MLQILSSPVGFFCRCVVFICVAVLLLLSRPAEAGEVLDRIRTRQSVRCGSEFVGGTFARKDETGKWEGFDADFCRALSLAVFGFPDRISMVPVTPANRFALLKNGTIDVLLGATAFNATNSIVHNVEFTSVLYHSSQGFMAHFREGATSMADYKKARVCVLQGSSDYDRLVQYDDKYRLDFRIFPQPSMKKAKEFFFLKRCDLFTGSMTLLRSDHLRNFPESLDLVILPEIVDRQPTGPAVGSADSDWRKLVKWTVYALVKAEEKNITKENVEFMLSKRDGEIRLLLGQNPKIAQALGVSPRWVYQIITHLGNYGEIFVRNLGPESGMDQERGPNKLWLDGGMMWAPPFL